MQGLTRTRGIIAGVCRRWWEMLMQQNARDQTQHCRLIRNRFIVKTIGDPCLTGDIVKPSARASRPHHRQLRKQIIIGPEPANPLVGFFSIVDSRWAKAALDCRCDTIAQFLRGDAMDDWARYELQSKFFLHTSNGFGRHGHLATPLRQ